MLVYFDDIFSTKMLMVIIIIGNIDYEIADLNMQLAKEFEVKDLGQLRYFLEIEVSRSGKGICLFLSIRQELCFFI
jgi:hypothetical protein